MHTQLSLYTSISISLPLNKYIQLGKSKKYEEQCSFPTSIVCIKSLKLFLSDLHRHQEAEEHCNMPYSISHYITRPV